MIDKHKDDIFLEEPTMKDRILYDLRKMTRKQFISICRMQGRSFNYMPYYDFDNKKAGYMMKVYTPIGSNEPDITLWFDKNDKLVNFADY